MKNDYLMCSNDMEYFIYVTSDLYYAKEISFSLLCQWES
jgi:hypothetical protein